MAQLNDAQLLAFIAQYLPNNDDELITPSILRLVLAQLVDSKVSADVLVQFAKLASPRFTGVPQVPTAPVGTNSDQVASTAFVQATLLAIAGGKTLNELVLPQSVQGGNWYLTSSGIWEARSSFNAQANPISGPYWRLVAGFAGQLTTLPVASLSDATDAGRAMLTAPSAAAQRALVNNPRIPAGKYGSHPGFETEDGPAGSWAWVIQAILKLSSTPLVPALAAKPAAPTAGQVDDIGDIFSFLPSVDAPSFASHKVSGLPNTTGAEWLSPANSYVQNGRICVRVAGTVPAGGLAVYVGASGSVPDGHVLTNNADFTANNVVPTVLGALAVDFVVDNASLSPNDTLTFTAKASGGTAPYEHSVQALDPATGTVTVLGTASTASYVGTWKVPAGVYLVTDAVTDAAGDSLVSATRRVVVVAPGSGGGALVPATRTRLGGVRIGEGLTITEEGLLSADAGKLLESDNVWTGLNTYTQLRIASQYDNTDATVLERFGDGSLFAYNTKTNEDANFEGADFGSSKAPREWYYYSDLAQALAEYRDMPGKRVHWVQGGLTNPYRGGGPRGSVLRPYGSLAEALSYALDGDTIIVLPGGEVFDFLGRPAYGGYTLVDKNVTIINFPGVVQNGTVDVGAFQGERPFRVYWYGGIVTGSLNVLRQSTGASTFLGQDIRLEGAGQLQAFALGTYGAHRDTIEFRNTVFRQTEGAVQGIRITGRSDGPQVQDVIFTGYDFESVDSPFIRWLGSDGNGQTRPSQVFLRGSGRAVRADGGSYLDILPTTPFNTLLTEAQIVVDERTSGGGGGGSGTSYTDTQARAAQLNRVAPANTTTIRLTPESPIDYGTAASGTYTVDGTNCLVGKEAWFNIGPGGSAPVFDKAPAGQPFDTELGQFVPGKLNRYALRVFPDRIEVTNLAN